MDNAIVIVVDEYKRRRREENIENEFHYGESVTTDLCNCTIYTCYQLENK